MDNISSDAQAIINAAGPGALDYVKQQRWQGNKLTSGEATQILTSFKPQQQVIATIPANPGTQIQQSIGNLASGQFQFDPNQYLPAIQQQAQSIYSPQQAQLQALRELSASQFQETKITTEKDFQKRMQQEIEAMNRRGAGFSGGAILNEQDIRDQQAGTLKQIGLSYQAQDSSLVAQQAQLAAEQAQFVQDKLSGVENSAYSRWVDSRNFSMEALKTQWGAYVEERNFARSVFESDRSYDTQQDQFAKTYGLQKEELKMAKAKFKEDKRQFGEQIALEKFKAQTARKNTGTLGKTSTGEDFMDWVAKLAQNMGINPTGNQIPSAQQQGGGTIPNASMKPVRDYDN